MAEQGDPVAITIIAADYLPDRSAAEGDGAGDSARRKCNRHLLRSSADGRIIRPPLAPSARGG
jgi:hypothetical protein